MKRINVPITNEDIDKLNVGDTLYLSGTIFCGRDMVLPKLINDLKDRDMPELDGSVIFHTAVSVAGIGPTSSNKIEIESSIIPLSKHGVKIHLGKGKIKQETVNQLSENNSVYAITPPVTALFNDKISSCEVIAYGELGMEAFYKLEVSDIPIIIAAAHGRSIYDK